MSKLIHFTLQTHLKLFMTQNYKYFKILTTLADVLKWTFFLI